jgi:hypothetical protein
MGGRSKSKPKKESNSSNQNQNIRPNIDNSESIKNKELAMIQSNERMNTEYLAAQKAMLDSQLKSAEAERLAAEKTAKEAAITSQSQMAQQASLQNLQDVEQKIAGRNVMQELADQNALKSYNKSLTTGAENVTGDFNFADSKQSALQQLGAASGTLPQTGTNTMSNIYGRNPAATTAASAVNKYKNKYTMPSTSGLTFGGT